MICSDCKRTLEVGDHYIHFTASEWAEAEGLTPMPELDDLMADIIGRSGLGDEMVFCEDCTRKGGKWIPDMVYGDETTSEPRFMTPSEIRLVPLSAEQVRRICNRTLSDEAIEEIELAFDSGLTSEEARLIHGGFTEADEFGGRVYTEPVHRARVKLRSAFTTPHPTQEETS